MLEGLKNVGAMFATMTKKALDHQFQRNVIAYVDDIVVMRKNKEDHLPCGDEQKQGRSSGGSQ